MNLELTPEQQLLADTVEELLQKRYTPADRLALLRSDAGWSRELWHLYAELGVLGLAIGEQHGGSGAGAAELLVVMRSFGRALVLEPYLSTVVLGASLVAAAGSAEQRGAVLPAVVAGDALLAFAYAEAPSRWSLTDIETQYASGRISGQKIAVPGGDSADRLIVTARTPDGVGLFLVDGGDVARDSYPMQDGVRGADVLLRDAPATPLGAGGDAVAVIEDVLELATAALCAEAVGAMERMLELTVDYLKTRVQFGRPIASFQALQFRAADLYVSLEQARSAALIARLALDDPDRHARRAAIRAAKIQVDVAVRHIAQEAIQLHGGIGMTMEYPVGHYAKRTTVIAKTFADTDLLLAQLGAGGGLS
jgi:alkylation response protein AidB-like acyl-CoA dehydrogenase